MITVSSVVSNFRRSSQAWKRRAKALEIHMHFGGFSQHSFVHFFFLSAWGVMSLGHVVSSVLDLCMECDIVQLSVYLILGYLFPHSLYFSIIMALCGIIVDL